MQNKRLPGPQCDFHCLFDIPRPCSSQLPFLHLTEDKTTLLFCEDWLQTTFSHFGQLEGAARFVRNCNESQVPSCIAPLHPNVDLFTFFQNIFKNDDLIEMQYQRPGPVIVSRTAWVQVFVGNGSCVQLRVSDSSPKSRLIEYYLKSNQQLPSILKEKVAIYCPQGRGTESTKCC